MLAQPLTDVMAWTRFLRSAPIPVLADTAAALTALSEVENRTGNVDAHMIGEAISNDPLMTLRLFAYMAQHRNQRQVTDVYTVTSSVVLMGIGPFFQALTPATSVDEHLQAHPEACTQVYRLVRRAWCSARLVTEFALLHDDVHAPALQIATLLHHYTEMLLWCHAPLLADHLAQARLQQPTVPSATLEKNLLHTDLVTLQHHLSHAWGLPQPLLRLMDPLDTHHPMLLQPQRRLLSLGVTLATRLETQPDSEPSLQELEELSELLTLSPAAVLSLIHNTLVD